MDALDGRRVSEAVRIEAATGRFSVARSNYTDPALFRTEMDRIFSKCWLFVGHTSELAQPDQFVTRNVGGRSIIFLRDHDGTFMYRDPVSGVGHVLFVLDMPPDPTVRAKLVAYRADGSAQTTTTVPLVSIAVPPAVPSTAVPRSPTTSIPSK